MLHNLTKCKFAALMVVAISAVLLCVPAISQAQRYDWAGHHLKRTAPNLVPNPSVKGPGGYELGKDPKGRAKEPAAYDPDVSRTPGSGSFCLREA